MPPLRHCLALVLSCLVLLCVTAAEAQVFQPPSRVFQLRPVSGRAQQELTLTTNLLVGIGTQLTPEASVEGSRPVVSTGFSNTSIRYLFGTQENSFEARGRGFLSAYDNFSSGPDYGGDLELRGRAELGRRTDMTVSQQVRSNPFFGLAAFDSLLLPGIDPSYLDERPLASNPITAVNANRSLELSTRLTASRELTRRSTIRGSYGYAERTFEDDAAFDSRTHEGALSYDRSLGRSSGLVSMYRYSSHESRGSDGVRLPFEVNTLEFGFRYGKDISSTRRLQISGAAGTEWTDTIDGSTQQAQRFWRPSARGTASVDLSRTWVLHANFRRSVDVLQGVSSEPFFTDLVSVGLGGLLKERIQLIFSGAYATGNARGVSGSQFDSYAVSSQVNVPVTDWWSVMASYTHYRYSLEAVASQALLLPPTMNRNAVYMGLTLTAPLMGSRR